LEFLGRFLKNPQLSNFIKILVRAAMFRADERTNELGNMTTLIVAVPIWTNAHNKSHAHEGNQITIPELFIL
jgi:hypothetical protein